MDLTSVLGSILSSASSQSNGSLGAAANGQSVDMGALLKQLASNGGSDIFGSILKNITANASASANANAQAQNGSVLGSVLKSVITGNAANSQASANSQVQAQAQNGNVLGAVLGQLAGKSTGSLSNMSGTDILSMATQASTILNSILGKK